MNQNLRHAQCIGHRTRMLPSCASKALQGIARDIVATSNRNFLYGMRHLLNSDMHKAFGNFFGRFV